MKKSLLCLFSFVSLLFAFVSCNDKNEGPGLYSTLVNTVWEYTANEAPYTTRAISVEGDTSVGAASFLGSLGLADLDLSALLPTTIQASKLTPAMPVSRTKTPAVYTERFIIEADFLHLQILERGVLVEMYTMPYTYAYPTLSIMAEPGYEIDFTIEGGLLVAPQSGGMIAYKDVTATYNAENSVANNAPIEGTVWSGVVMGEPVALQFNRYTAAAVETGSVTPMALPYSYNDLSVSIGVPGSSLQMQVAAEYLFMEMQPSLGVLLSLESGTSPDKSAAPTTLEGTNWTAQLDALLQLSFTTVDAFTLSEVVADGPANSLDGTYTYENAQLSLDIMDTQIQPIVSAATIFMPVQVARAVDAQTEEMGIVIAWDLKK